MRYTAILLAGSRAGFDPFAAQFGTDMKALVALGGEPMVRRPMRALLASKGIAKILVLSQSPSRIADVVPSDPRIAFRKSLETIGGTMLDICSDPEILWPLLVTTADHALLDTKTIDEFAYKASSLDIAIGVVERTNLLSRLPKAERTWHRFRKGSFTGANLFMLQSPAVRPAIELWRAVEQDRKKAWRLLSLLGPVVLLCAALRVLSMDEILDRLGRRLGLRIAAVRLSNPLAGMDVDKPADHTLAEAILAGKA